MIYLNEENQVILESRYNNYDRLDLQLLEAIFGNSL